MKLPSVAAISHSINSTTPRLGGRAARKAPAVTLRVKTPLQRQQLLFRSRAEDVFHALLMPLRQFDFCFCLRHRAAGARRCPRCLNVTSAELLSLSEVPRIQPEQLQACVSQQPTHSNRSSPSSQQKTFVYSCVVSSCWCRHTKPACTVRLKHALFPATPQHTSMSSACPATWLKEAAPGLPPR